MEAAKNRDQILASALEAREQEIMHYQINIDNYALALEKIGKLSVEDRAELSAFADQLRALLASEKIEQKKARIMFEVLKDQIDSV